MEAREAIKEAPSALRARLGEDIEDKEESEGLEEGFSDEEEDFEKFKSKEKKNKKLTYMTENIHNDKNNRKFDQRNAKQKKDERFQDYKKSKFLESDIVKEMENELEGKPIEIVKKILKIFYREKEGT